ncbi:MAG: hypothetical protein ACPGEF_04480 [Endozoicomonas sp.]
MKKAAVELVKNMGCRAIEYTRYRPLKLAVAIEYLSNNESDFHCAINDIDRYFNDDEKCAILAALQTTYSGITLYSFFINLEISGEKRFDFLKELF